MWWNKMPHLYPRWWLWQIMFKRRAHVWKKVNGTFMLKRKHNYHFQVQQQLFTLPERKSNDFVVFAIDSDENARLVRERIYPEPQRSNTVLPKLEVFWRICILWEILGRWFTRRCDVLTSVLNDNGICFCRSQNSENVVSCIIGECYYRKFNIICLPLSVVLQCSTEIMVLPALL